MFWRTVENLEQVVSEPVCFFADISNLKKLVWNSCGWLFKIDTLTFSVEWLLSFLIFIHYNFLNYKNGVSWKDIRISIYSGSRKYAFSQFYNRIIQFTKVMPLSRLLLGNFHAMYPVEETRTRRLKPCWNKTRIRGVFYASFMSGFP